MLEILFYCAQNFFYMFLFIADIFNIPIIALSVHNAPLHYVKSSVYYISNTNLNFVRVSQTKTAGTISDHAPDLRIETFITLFRV